jgi:pyridoxamine 5'-phosphate oxidase
MARAFLNGIHASDLDADPIVEFQRWYALARRLRIPMATATTLATASPDGMPSARMVLLKDVDASGFVFYTNYQSRKARELEANPRATLLIYWKGIERQVRMEGSVERVSAEQSQAYFASRPRGSRVGAWASRQSEEAANRAELEAAFEKAEAEHADDGIPCPPFWGGYRLHPSRIEFWQGRAARLHDRFLYTREGDRWRRVRLYP